MIRNKKDGAFGHKSSLVIPIDDVQCARSTPRISRGSLRAKSDSELIIVKQFAHVRNKTKRRDPRGIVSGVSHASSNRDVYTCTSCVTSRKISVAPRRTNLASLERRTSEIAAPAIGLLAKVEIFLRRTLCCSLRTFAEIRRPRVGSDFALFLFFFFLSSLVGHFS